MNQREYEVLAEIFADPDLATTEEIDKELENAGIDYPDFRERILSKIADFKREIIYAEGNKKIERFKQLFIEIRDKLNIKRTDAELEAQLKLAFNKLGELTPEDIQKILLDEEKLKYLKELINKKDKQGDSEG